MMMAPEAHKPDRWALHLILSSPPPHTYSSSIIIIIVTPPSISPLPFVLFTLLLLFFFFFNQPFNQSAFFTTNKLSRFTFFQKKKEAMDATTLELMDGSGGGTLGSGNSLSTVSESYSSHPEEESDLELGLGLSIGGGGGLKKSKVAVWGQCPGRNRILTAEDFPSGGFSKSSSSSSSGSSATKASNASCGSKRAAESSCSPPRAALSQVVGWPPIRTYRINSLVSQTKPLAVEEDFSEKCKNKVHVVDINKSDANKNSFFVKVNMDGVMIGRKVDLAAHSNYDSLARTLDDMFFIRIAGAEYLNPEEKKAMTEAPGLSDGSSEFVLTYEDKEGDWMLVGDVPWEIFVCSVKRLRIARKSEANGLGPSLCNERNGREA